MATESKFGVVVGLVLVILVAVVYHSPAGPVGAAPAESTPAGGAGNTSPRVNVPPVG